MFSTVPITGHGPRGMAHDVAGEGSPVSSLELIFISACPSRYSTSAIIVASGARWSATTSMSISFVRGGRPGRGHLGGITAPGASASTTIAKHMNFIFSIAYLPCSMTLQSSAPDSHHARAETPATEVTKTRVKILLPIAAPQWQKHSNGGRQSRQVPRALEPDQDRTRHQTGATVEGRADTRERTLRLSPGSLFHHREPLGHQQRQLEGRIEDVGGHPQSLLQQTCGRILLAEDLSMWRSETSATLKSGSSR